MVNCKYRKKENIDLATNITLSLGLIITETRRKEKKERKSKWSKFDQNILSFFSFLRVSGMISPKLKVMLVAKSVFSFFLYLQSKGKDLQLQIKQKFSS